jgi:hypothetical protein
MTRRPADRNRFAILDRDPGHIATIEDAGSAEGV